MALGNLHGDGKLDLAGTSASGSVSVLRGKSDGTFAAVIEHFVEEDLSSLALGDLNGDGVPDIVVTSSGSDTCGLLFNTRR